MQQSSTTVRKMSQTSGIWTNCCAKHAAMVYSLRRPRRLFAASLRCVSDPETAVTSQTIVYTLECTPWPRTSIA